MIGIRVSEVDDWPCILVVDPVVGTDETAPEEEATFKVEKEPLVEGEELEAVTELDGLEESVGTVVDLEAEEMPEVVEERG